MPPETYGSPEEWLARTVEVEDGIRVPALGPYPSRGEYEHCFTLEERDGEFMPFGPAACDWVRASRGMGAAAARRAARAAIASREAQRERDWDRAADDSLDEAVPHFMGSSSQH